VLFIANGTTKYLPYSQFPEFYPDPKIPKQQECYMSWSSWYSTIGGAVRNYTMQNVSITTRVYVYETLNSFGPNTTYTECDGIPRLSFLKSATSTSAGFVTATVTHRVGYRIPSALKRNEMPLSCSDLGPWNCRKMYEMANQDIGPGNFSIGQTMGVPPVQSVCPIQYACLPLLNEVVLLHWPDNVASRNVCASHGHGASVTRPWGNSTASVFVTNAITFAGQDMYIRSIDGMNCWDYGRSFHNRTGEYWTAPFEIYDEIMRTVNLLQVNITSGKYLKSSVMQGPFTFTSPTVYLAHRPITRYMQISSDGNYYLVFSTLRPAGTIPLHSTEIFSVYPIPANGQAERGYEFAKSVANGSYHAVFDEHLQLTGGMVTRSFNLGDLLNPVPASAYYAARFDCFGQQTHCGTITEDSYRPKIRLDPKIWRSIYGSIACRDALVVDPPISLHPIGQYNPGAGRGSSSPFNSPMDNPVSIYTAQPSGQQGGRLPEPTLSPHPSPANSAIPPYPLETNGPIQALGSQPGFFFPGRLQPEHGGGQNPGVLMPGGISPASIFGIFGSRLAPLSGILSGLVGESLGIGSGRDQGWRILSWIGDNLWPGSAGRGNGRPSKSDPTRPENWSGSDLSGGKEGPDQKHGGTKATPSNRLQRGTSSKTAASHGVWLVSLVLGGTAIFL
jgi:hypothetical protein